MTSFLPFLLGTLSCIGCLIAENKAVNPNDFAISSVDQQFIRDFPFDRYRICNVPKQGAFYIDTASDTIKQRLSQGLPWEPSTDEVIWKYVVPGSTVLDIGAHIGTHSVTMSRAVGYQGTVIAFEPQKKIFRELCKNLELNNCCNVKPLHVALGTEEKTAFLGIPENFNEGGRSVETSGPEEVLMRPLDSYNLNNISFIKMDVENFEDEVLDGSIKTLLKNRPILFLEIQGNRVVVARRKVNREEKVKGTIRKLEKLGYIVSFFSGDDYIAVPVTK